MRRTQKRRHRHQRLLRVEALDRRVCLAAQISSILPADFEVAPFDDPTDLVSESNSVQPVFDSPVSTLPYAHEDWQSVRVEPNDSFAPEAMGLFESHAPTMFDMHESGPVTSSFNFQSPPPEETSFVEPDLVVGDDYGMAMDVQPFGEILELDSEIVSVPYGQQPWDASIPPFDLIPMSNEFFMTDDPVVPIDEIIGSNEPVIIDLQWELQTDFVLDGFDGGSTFIGELPPGSSPIALPDPLSQGLPVVVAPTPDPLTITDVALTLTLEPIPEFSGESAIIVQESGTDSLTSLLLEDAPQLRPIPLPAPETEVSESNASSQFVPAAPGRDNAVGRSAPFHNTQVSPQLFSEVDSSRTTTGSDHVAQSFGPQAVTSGKLQPDDGADAGSSADEITIHLNRLGGELARQAIPSTRTPDNSGALGPIKAANLIEQNDLQEVIVEDLGTVVVGQPLGRFAEFGVFDVFAALEDGGNIATADATTSSPGEWAVAELMPSPAAAIAAATLGAYYVASQPFRRRTRKIDESVRDRLFGSPAELENTLLAVGVS